MKEGIRAFIIIDNITNSSHRCLSANIRRLKKILYAMEWQRLKDGRGKREIKEELDFRQMERANDTELGESVLVDYFLGYILEEQNLINFIGWFYNAKELKR